MASSSSFAGFLRLETDVAVHAVESPNVGEAVLSCRSGKEKGRRCGGLKVGSGEDPSPEYDLEKHIGGCRFFDLDQTGIVRMY